MTRIVRLADRRVRIEDDGFVLLREAGAEIAETADAIVPLADWLARGEALRARAGKTGVWLAGADDPKTLADHFDGLALIAIDFPVFKDGRGYSLGTLLRKRHGWSGPMRAVGDVLRDQMFYLARAGFTEFQVPEHKDIEVAAAGLEDFTLFYQDSAVGGVPALRNRAAAVREAKIVRAERLIREIAAKHPDAALATSFSAEDMVVTDLIARNRLPLHIFTLDTGRLHDETLGMIGETEKHYGIALTVMKPVQAAVDAHVAAHGAYAFYDSLELRKACCGIRKVEPLNRALSGRSAWITGQRREQAVTRAQLPEQERDAERGMEKFNPLSDWTWDDVLAYAARFDVPLNPLHARGYPSIGCEPCTRPVRPGEDPRAGRWWWEQSDKKECGLHAANISTLESAA